MYFRRMYFPVKVFEIDRDASAVVKPREIETLTISANTVDQARKKVREKMKDRKIRSLSMLADGGIAVVLIAQENADASN